MNTNFHAFTLSFNGITPQLITKVEIYPAFDPAKPPKLLPDGIVYNALWDTGATNSNISRRIIEQLKLTSVGMIRMEHAGGSHDSNRYIVNLKLPNEVGVSGVFVNECSLPANLDMLIGMDIITMGDFSLSHLGSKTLFSFRIPSIESIDFVKQHNKMIFTGVGANDTCPCGSGEKFKKCHRE